MTIDLKAIRAAADTAANKYQWVDLDPGTVITLCDEIERLTACLKKANDQAEHFEREWYLRGDRLEAAETEVLEQARLLGIGGEKELALMAKLEAAEKDAARYRWLQSNHPVWSWQPSRYNSEIISGFACNNTGYSGFAFKDALALAMKEQK